MSRADRILVVVLKAQPFRDIEAGVKLEEYRGANWAKRILSSACYHMLWRHKIRPDAMPWQKAENPTSRHDFHPYHTLRAFLGYAKDRPMIERPITHIDWGLPNPTWTYGIVSPGECFRIHLEPKTTQICVGSSGAGMLVKKS